MKLKTPAKRSHIYWNKRTSLTHGSCLYVPARSRVKILSTIYLILELVTRSYRRERLATYFQNKGQTWCRKSHRLTQRILNGKRQWPLALWHNHFTMQNTQHTDRRFFPNCKHSGRCHTRCEVVHRNSMSAIVLSSLVFANIFSLVQISIMKQIPQNFKSRSSQVFQPFWMPAWVANHWNNYNNWSSGEFQR